MLGVSSQEAQLLQKNFEEGEEEKGDGLEKEENKMFERVALLLELAKRRPLTEKPN